LPASDPFIFSSKFTTMMPMGMGGRMGRKPRQALPPKELTKYEKVERWVAPKLKFALHHGRLLELNHRLIFQTI
jgi:hypothetical protein